MAEGSPSAESVLDELRQTLRHDAASGSVRALGEYLKRFPGHDKEVASEYLSSASPRLGARGASGAVAGASGAAPATIGPYRLVKELGRGGQGIVYLAEDTRLARRVALKVLPELAQASGEVLLRFHREAEAASRVDHPGVATVYDAGVADGVPYIAMRYVEGETLAARIGAAHSPSSLEAPSLTITVDDDERRDASHGAAPTNAAPAASSRHALRGNTERVLRLFVKIAEALHAAHERGIVHRDVKPQNVLLGRDGQPVVLDFGLARDMDSDSQAMTRAGDFFGTPAYMSPEQLLASRVKLDRRTDVWSLGACLYECLTLRKPFEAPTREALYVAIQTKDPTPARRLNPSLPADLEVVLDTALEKDRDRRYHTAREFADELRRVLAVEPIHARPAGVLLKLRRFCQRRPAVAASLAFAFLSLGGGLAASLTLLGRARAERDAKELQRGIAVTAMGEIDAELAKKRALLESLGFEDSATLADLEHDAEQLWPSVPARIPDFERWLARAAELEKSLPKHRRQLEELDARRADSAASAAPADGFDRAQLEWQRATIEGLVLRLDDFLSPDWSENSREDVEERLGFAREVQGRTIDRAADRWRRAIESIADPKECPQYRGLRIVPQLGLIPIDRDPESGLWEFVHVETSEYSDLHDPDTAAAQLTRAALGGGGDVAIPARDPESGRLVVTGEMGLVFVLLPGGTFREGAMAPDATHPIGSPNVDPQLDPKLTYDESPVREATVAPFFVSKYEMTQGQWRRAAGGAPSVFRAGFAIAGRQVDRRHPVESVSWKECDRALRQLGLALPSNAQWEYAARAGTTSVYLSGDDVESLRDPLAANLSDSLKETMAAPSPTRVGYTPATDWSDGWIMHAPVGTFAPNAFGLYDTIGNVFEWCRGVELDGVDEPKVVPSSRWLPDAEVRVRGGSFMVSPNKASSASGERTGINFRNCDLGLRPIRELDPK